MHVPGLIQPECVLDGGGRKHQGKASLEKVVPGQAAQLQLVHIQLHYSTQFNSIWLNKMIFCAFWRWTFQTDHAFSSTHFFWQLQRKVQKSERRFNRATISLNNVNQDSAPECQSVTIAKKQQQQSARSLKEILILIDWYFARWCKVWSVVYCARSFWHPLRWSVKQSLF